MQLMQPGCGPRSRSSSCYRIRSAPTISITFTGMATQCEIAFSTNVVNFGAVLVSSNQTMTVTISNTNTVPCTINSIRTTGSFDFSLDPIVPTTQFSLGPGASVLVPIHYQPSGVGTDNGTLQVSSDDPDGPVSVTLSGSGVRCDLRVSTLTVDFGNVNVGSTNTMPLRLINQGGTNCVVNSLTILGNSSFSITNSLVFPLTVGTGTNNTVELGIQYLPTDVETIIIQGGSVNNSGGIIGVVPPTP